MTTPQTHDEDSLSNLVLTHLLDHTADPTVAACFDSHEALDARFPEFATALMEKAAHYGVDKATALEHARQAFALLEEEMRLPPAPPAPPEEPPAPPADKKWLPVAGTNLEARDELGALAASLGIPDEGTRPSPATDGTTDPGQAE